MNVVKFYKNGKIARVQTTQPRTYDARSVWRGNRPPTVPEAEAVMTSNGFTRKPPTKPHNHPAQQPGYKQPSAQALRQQRRRL